MENEIRPCDFSLFLSQNLRAIRNEGSERLSLERVLRTLESFGLKRVEAEMYVYLAKKGPKTREDIARVMKMPEIRLHQVLESLKKKEFVIISNESFELFAALAFSELLDMMIAIKDEETQVMKETSRELLSQLAGNNPAQKKTAHHL